MNPKSNADGFQLLPVADGETELVGNVLGHPKFEFPITSLQRRPPNIPISFTNDVMPVLTRSGCNTGSCHGAARGKGRFSYEPVWL